MELTEKLAEALTGIYMYIRPYLSLWSKVLLVGGFILMASVLLISYKETRNKRFLWAIIPLFAMTTSILLIGMIAKR